MKWQILLFSEEQGCFHIESNKAFFENYDIFEVNEDDFLLIDIIKNEKQLSLIHKFTHTMYLVNGGKNGRIEATTLQVQSALDIFKGVNKIMFTAKKLPKEPGVYFIYNQNKNLIYIGKSDNLRHRIPKSINERSGAYFSFALTESASAAIIYELFYIHKLQPKLNYKKHNDLNFNIPDLVFTGLLPAKFVR